MKHFTLESASLHSIPEKNVLNSQTFYSSILFQRPFLSAFRGPLSRDTPSLEPYIQFTVHFYSFHTYVTSFTHFTLHFLCIYIARAEYFLIPHDADDRLKLGFQFLLFKQQLKASLEQFYIFLIMLLKDNMNRLVKPVLSVHLTDSKAEVPKLISLSQFK